MHVTSSARAIIVFDLTTDAEVGCFLSENVRFNFRYFANFGNASC